MTLDDFARLLNTTDATTVLIDGRSGSGKSTLADHLQRRWASSAVVRLDHIYPGWGGLAWTVDHIRTALLQPRAAGRTGRWQRWNWARAAPDGWRTVEANQRLILEGVGALTTANRALADLGIWIDTPDVVRRQRALQRDGDTYRPYWDRWAAQEDDFIAQYAPRSAADYLATAAAHSFTWTFRKTEHDFDPV